jgi:hypothetical protein
MNNTEHKSPWNSDAATAGKLAPKWLDNAVFRTLGFMAGKLFALAAGLLALLTLGLIRGFGESLNTYAGNGDKPLWKNDGTEMDDPDYNNDGYRKW